MEFPSDLFFCWLSCGCCGWGGLNLWNYRPVSFLPSLCHSGVATIINAGREPQVALTLQPYLWLASWNEHYQQHTCTQTHTHLSPGAWRNPVEHVCLETGPLGPPGDTKWHWVIQSLHISYKHVHLNSIMIMLLLLVLTLGYLSIFSFICASLRDLVINGVSSKDFLEERGRERQDTVIMKQAVK